MKIPDNSLSFWSEFQVATGIDASERFYEAFHFDDNERDANALIRLVLSGVKQGTASLLWTYEATKKPLPKPGVFSIVTKWNTEPVCVMETTEVEIVPYENVTQEFAAFEGEGDKTLRHWQQVHWAYFGRECKRLGRQASPQMPVVCEKFSVVYPLPI